MAEEVKETPKKKAPKKKAAPKKAAVKHHKIVSKMLNADLSKMRSFELERSFEFVGKHLMRSKQYEVLLEITKRLVEAKCD